jgi:signal transduction histidine kinase/CheY-like chemotaxis protein
MLPSAPAAPVGLRPDTSAYHWLDLPVAWTDAQGWLLGANPAFEAATGHRADAVHAQRLTDLLGLDGSSSDLALAHGLTSGLDFAPLPFAGRDAQGQPLVGLLGQRCQAGWCIVTLQAGPLPAMPPQPPHRFWDLRALRDGTRDGTRDGSRDGSRGAPTGQVVADSVPPPGQLDTGYSLDTAQAHFDMASTLAGIGIWQHDAATGLLHGNRLGWSLLGLPAQADGLALGALASRLHPEDLPAVMAQFADSPAAKPPDNSTLAGAAPPHERDGPIELGARWRHSDGRWRYLLTRRVARRDDNGQLLGHVGVVLDLSDRFDQQQLALALAQRLEMATAAAGVGIWSADLGSPAGEANAVHWDEQMRALHGLDADTPAPALPAYIARWVLDADRASVTESMATLLQRRDGLLDLDLRILRLDGQVRRLATRSTISGAAGQRHLHGVMLDVTERHSTEDQLRQANERAALAARGAGIGTWESDAVAAVGWWDAQMFRLRGREPLSGPVRTDQLLAWLHPADRELYSRTMQAALQGDAPSNTEFRVVLPDGSVRWLASRSTPVRDEQGRTVRRIGINWDITDVRNAAAVREERVLAQRESQAKSRLLARISHELRTPLNAVLGFSQLLLADGVGPDPATWRRRVAHIQASGEHLLALIDDVLDLSSLQSGELPLSLQPVALAGLARTSLPLVELLARDHGVSLQLGPLDGWALADPVRLRQVLLNLLSNAIKYNRPGGSVTVNCAADAGWLLLRVEDTGRGLDAEQISHLFEPFNRLGMEREGIAGTGIGLAIVQASVQHMGGTVRVRSVPGQGSCFELSLQQARAPAAAPAAPAASAAPATPATPTTPATPADPAAGHAAQVPALPAADHLLASKRLLYIEDNEVNLLIVSELVRSRSDLEFLSAADGGSGLACAQARLPALILLDMQLPDMDGFEVLRRLRADPLTADIRCIALSANAMPDDIRRARAAGFDDYWTKPLDLRAFMRAMDLLFGPATD